MSLRSLSAAIALSLTASAAHAQSTYYVVSGGAQFQIGAGQMRPLQAATTGGTMMSPVGTMTMFPPLLIPPKLPLVKATVKQTAGPDPRQLTLPPGVLRRVAPGAKIRGIARHDERVFQVRTNLAFSVPAPVLGPAVLKKSGRTGAPVTTFIGTPAKSNIRYSKTAAQFGGPAQAKVTAVSPVKLWLNLGAKLPCKHPAFGGADASCVAPLVFSRPASLVAAGGPVGVTVMSLGGPAPSPGLVRVSVPNTTGLVAASLPVPSGGFTDMATSVGFPWTTGMITISQPSAAGTPEVFTITGMDFRLKGLGTISLVSGALSKRPMTGANSNRGWMRFMIPEPGAVLGTAAALAALALCHGLVRYARPTRR